MLKPKKNKLSLKDKIKVAKAAIKTIVKAPTKASKESVRQLNSDKAAINEEFPGAFKKKGGATKDKNWIQKAVNPAHKGYCTPMTKPTCTPKRKALAKTFKAMAKKR
jgi:hypothetical protein